MVEAAVGVDVVDAAAGEDEIVGEAGVEPGDPGDPPRAPEFAAAAAAA